MDPTNEGITPDAGKSPPINTPTSVDSSTQTEGLDTFDRSPNLRTIANAWETPGNNKNSPLDAKKPAKPFSIDHLLSDAVGNSPKRKEPCHEFDSSLQIDLSPVPERKSPISAEVERKVPNTAENPFKIVARGTTDAGIKRYRVHPQQLPSKTPRPPFHPGPPKYHVVPPKDDKPPEKGARLKAPMKIVLTTGNPAPKATAQNSNTGGKFCKFPATVPWKYPRSVGPATPRLRLVVGGQKAADKPSPSPSTPPSKGTPSSSPAAQPVVVKSLPAGSSTIRVMRRIPPSPPSDPTVRPKDPGFASSFKRPAASVPPNSVPRWFPPVPARSKPPTSPVMKVVRRIAPPLLSQPTVSLPLTASGASTISPSRKDKRAAFSYVNRICDDDSSDDSADETPAAKKEKLSPEKKDADKQVLSYWDLVAKRKEDDGKGLWIACSLCDNHIMTSRMTNLTNHAKRHCAIKQFSCAHCKYQHNEHHKVRMHMIGYHNDSKTAPKNNHSFDMERAWGMIMSKCFPGFAAFPMQTQSKRLGDSKHTCTECNEEVIPYLDSLVVHLTLKHPELCKVYRCTTCDYSNPDEGIVSWHVFKRHSHIAYIVDVVEKPLGSNMDIFLHRYFPSIAHCLPKPVDIEENRFMSQTAAVRFIWYAGTRGQRRPAIRPLIKEESDEEVDVLLPINYTPQESPKKKGEGKAKEGKDEETDEEEDSLIEVDSERKEPSPADTEDSMGLGPLCKLTRPAVDRNTLGPNDLLCELCEKVLMWSNKKSLAALLGHAKRHFRIKQYECPSCDYCSSEAAHVRTHIERKHKEGGVLPRENNDEFMQKSWIRVMKSCFPPLTDRISMFRFKTPKGRFEDDVEEEKRKKEEEEYVEDTAPVVTVAPGHKYDTRRKKRQQVDKG